MCVNLTDNYEDLVTCFFKECERQFRFLETDHGFKYFSGIIINRNGREIITPYRKHKFDGPFWITTLYERANIVLEIKYSDTNFCIEPYLYYDQIDRLEWADILCLTSSNITQSSKKHHLKRTKDLQDTIGRFSALMKENVEYFTAPTKNLIKKAMTLREKRIEHAIKDRAHKQMNHISKSRPKLLAKGIISWLLSC